MYLIYYVKQNPDWRVPTLCNLTTLNKTLSFVPTKSLYIVSKINQLTTDSQVYTDNGLNIRLPSQVTNSYYIVNPSWAPFICALSND